MRFRGESTIEETVEKNARRPKINHILVDLRSFRRCSTGVAQLCPATRLHSFYRLRSWFSWIAIETKSQHAATMATSSPSPRKKGRKWRGKIKFWKAQGAGGGELDRLNRLTDEDFDGNDESKGIGASVGSHCSSTHGSAGTPSKSSGGDPPAASNSWSFQEAFASVVQSIEEATEDAKSPNEGAHQSFADVVKSFDHSSDEEDNNSLAGESRQSFGVESDQISFSFGQNSMIEPSFSHVNSASNTTASSDGVSRAVQAANGALAFSTTKSYASGQGASASKSFTSSRSGHNSRTSSKSGLFSNLTKTSSQSTRTTEDLSPSVQLLTEVMSASGSADADQGGQDGRQNSVSRMRSFGSASLSSLLPGRKKKEKKSTKVKKREDGFFGSKKKISNVGGDQSIHTGSSTTPGWSSSTPEGQQLRQKIRREAIVRELMDDDNTFQSYDDETYDGTLGTNADWTLADDEEQDEQNIALHLMEQFDTLFLCNSMFLKTPEDPLHEVSDDEDNPAADQSCCGTASIFNSQHEEAPEEEEDQTVRTFDDETYDDGTYDNGTIGTNTYCTDTGTYDDRTCDTDTVEGTYDGTYDEITMDTATDNGTLDDTLDGDTLENEYHDNSFLSRPKLFGRTRSEPSEASSVDDQSHIYMMMTTFRRQKSEIPKEIAGSPTKNHKVGTGQSQRSTSAFDSVKSLAQAEREPMSPAQLWDKGILGLTPSSPSGWSETYLQDEPTTTNPNPNSIQKEWLKLIEESIQKRKGEDNGTHASRSLRGKLKRRAAAADVLQRMLQEATAKKKHAR